LFAACTRAFATVSRADAIGTHLPAVRKPVHGHDLPPKTLAWCGDVTRVVQLHGGTTSAIHELGLADGRRLVLRRYTAGEWQGAEPQAIAERRWRFDS
jgi:hypothetical protein